jgi:nitrile hydratase subunit beta
MGDDDLQALGPIPLEKPEPVSRAPWEARLLAIWSAMHVPQMKDYVGEQTEESPPDDPALDYFQQRYAQIIASLLATGLITPAELESGRPAEGVRKAAPLLTTDIVDSWFSSNDHPWKSDVEIGPRFQVGQLVYVSEVNLDPQRRCARYPRGKFGVIERDHGVFVVPYRNEQRLDDESQHLYSVRFSACQLWGQAHPKDSVVVNMWGDELHAI